MKRQIIIVGSALLILLISVGLSSFFASQKKAPEFEKPTVVRKQVTTQKVEYKTLKTNVVAYGRVETAQSLDLLSEVAGRMYRGNLQLKAGERFKKGQLIFYIDEQEASLNLKSQKSNFLRDLAAILPDLKIDFSSNYQNWKNYFDVLALNKKFPDLPAVEDNKEKTFLATKGIYSAYYAIKSAEARLDKYRYYAPFDGAITEINFQSGSFINPGISIGKIIRTGFHELKVAIKTREIKWVTLGSEVDVYSGEMGATWTGVVNRIGDFVNRNTQCVDVFITIFPNGQKIYDGQFFRASIPARTINNGMIVPRNAIYNGNEVFLVRDTLLKTVQVNVLRMTDEQAIFHGPEEGEDLVIEPLVGAYNNMVVDRKPLKNLDLEIRKSSDKEPIEKKDNSISGT